MSIGGCGVNLRVKVARGERGHVICASPVFAGLVAVVEQPSVLLGVAESLPKLGVVAWYEVFRVLSRSGGWCGWCSGPFLALPRGAGSLGDEGDVGRMGGGRRLGEGRDRGCHTMLRVTNRCLEISQGLGGALVLSGGEVGQQQGDVVELLPNGLIFLGDGCELLGYPSQLMGDGDKPFDELGQESDGGRFGGDCVGQSLGSEIREVSGVEVEGTPGLGQLFRHEG